MTALVPRPPHVRAPPEKYGGPGTAGVAGGAGVGSGVSTELGRATVVCCYHLFRVCLPTGRSASGVRQLGRGITRGAGRSGPRYR